MSCCNWVWIDGSGSVSASILIRTRASAVKIGTFYGERRAALLNSKDTWITNYAAVIITILFMWIGQYEKCSSSNPKSII